MKSSATAAFCVAGAFTLFLLLIVTACGRRINEAKLVDELLLRHGFFFVWQTTTDARPGNFLLQPHAVNEQPSPTVIREGVAYVFYPKERANMQSLGEQQIPAWIGDLGCKVVSAPDSQKGGFSYPFLGGPEFDIRFHCGANAYRIEARVDPYLGASQNGKNSTALVLLRDTSSNATS